MARNPSNRSNLEQLALKGLRRLYQSAIATQSYTPQAQSRKSDAKFLLKFGRIVYTLPSRAERSAEFFGRSSAFTELRSISSVDVVTCLWCFCILRDRLLVCRPTCPQTKNGGPGPPTPLVDASECFYFQDQLLETPVK